MRYYIYVALPALLTKRVAAIEKRFGGYTASAPHITIVSPRQKTPRTRERDLICAIGDATSTLAPCQIVYGGVSYFGRKEYIYIPVRRGRGLARCHQACEAAVDGLLSPPTIGRQLTFRPHITLVSRLVQDEGTRAWQALRDEAFAGAFLCTEIRLFRKRTTDLRWQLVSRFALDA